MNIYSDVRHNTQCTYCGNHPKTRDHVPSKILLDKPYPDNLPVVPSCLDCNNSFSLDEEYFACFLECMKHGTTEINELSRENIKLILNRKPKLHSSIIESGMKTQRFENVLSKLAFGHIKYENSTTIFSKPKSIWHKPINLITEEESIYFFGVQELDKAPEVGSRANQRIFFSGETLCESWKHVEEGVYSYLVFESSKQIEVRLIIRDFLACEVTWGDTK